MVCSNRELREAVGELKGEALARGGNHLQGGVTWDQTLVEAVQRAHKVGIARKRVLGGGKPV